MIREAKREDLNALLHLYLSLHEKEIPEDSQNLRDTWNQILEDANHHLLVYELEGKIVSSLACVIIPNLTRGARPYALVENVVTLEDCRGRGYATECLRRARQIAEECGCYKIFLMTGAKKESTLNFYRNAGFDSDEKTAFICRLS